MKTIIKLEELAMTAAALFVLSNYNLGLSAWVWALLFFAPDTGMIGYAVNTRVGALTYNLLHHKGIAIALALCGFFLHSEELIATGSLLFAHSSFDRLFGYGLKYNDNFKNTHLGRIGNFN